MRGHAKIALEQDLQKTPVRLYVARVRRLQARCCVGEYLDLGEPCTDLAEQDLIWDRYDSPRCLLVEPTHVQKMSIYESSPAAAAMLTSRVQERGLNAFKHTRTMQDNACIGPHTTGE